MRRKAVSPGRRTRQASLRPVSAADRQDAIIEAALGEFTRNGFAATRMDDIARRAGVAKGTIYLRFKDKQSLFEAILRREIAPLIQSAGEEPAPGETVRNLLEQKLRLLLGEDGRARRSAVIRLLIAEAGRFPKLAETYFHTVVQPGTRMLEQLAQAAVKKGELSHSGPARYPQLLLAPAVLGLLWSGMFNRFQPLDLEGMLQAHLDVLFAGAPKSTKRKT